MPDPTELIKSGETKRSPYDPTTRMFGELGSGGLIDAINNRLKSGQPDLSGLGVTTAPRFSSTAAQYGRLAGSNPVQTAGMLQNEYAGLQGPSAAEQNLQDLATGTGVNPYYQQNLSNQLDDVANRVKDTYSATGNYGSRNFAQGLTDQLGRVSTAALADQFNRDTQNRLAANGMLDSAALARAGARQGILGDIGNVQQTNFGDKLNALGGRLNALQGQTGAQTADIAGRQAIENLRWADINNGLGALLPIASGFGTDTQYDQKTPLWQKILGGLSAFGGLIGGFGKSMPLGGGGMLSSQSTVM